MAGIKISDFTESTTPSGFEAAGVQGGENKKLDLGILADAATAAQATADAAVIAAGTAQSTANTAATVADAAAQQADAAMALAQTTQGGTDAVDTFVLVDNGDGTADILETPNGAKSMPVGNGAAGLSFPAAFWDAVNKVLALGDRGQTGRATINFPCDGSDVLGIQSDIVNGKTILTFFIGDDGTSEDSFRFVHRAPDGTLRQMLKMGIDSPTGQTLPFALFGGVMGFKAGEHYQGFIGNDAATGQTFWVLPAADGTMGQVLATDASGNLYWKNDGGEAQIFTISPESGNLYRLFRANTNYPNGGDGPLGTFLVNLKGPSYRASFLVDFYLGHGTRITLLDKDGPVPTFTAVSALEDAAYWTIYLSAELAGITENLRMGVQRLSNSPALEWAAPQTTPDTETVTLRDLTTGGGGGTSSAYYDFIPQATAPATVEGRVYFNDVLKSWAGIDAAGNEMEFGREFKLRCYNGTGTAIANGAPVAVVNNLAGMPSIVLARSNAKSTCTIVGIATTDIPDGGVGEVCFRGYARDLNTLAYPANSMLYISPDTAGGLVTTAPAYPNFVALVGFVLVSHATNGIILVMPDTDPQQSTTGVHGLQFRESTFPATLYASGKCALSSTGGHQFGTSFYAGAGHKPQNCRIRTSQGTSSLLRLAIYNEDGTVKLAQSSRLSFNSDQVVVGTFINDGSNRAQAFSADLVPGTMYHAVLCGKYNTVYFYGRTESSLNNNPRMGFSGQIVMADVGGGDFDCPSDISSIIGAANSDRAWIELY